MSAKNSKVFLSVEKISLLAKLCFQSWYTLLWQFV